MIPVDFAGLQLLQHVLDSAGKNPNIVEAYLHVQTRYLCRNTKQFSRFNLFPSFCCSNDEAIKFYLSNGFEQMDMIQNYYKHIDPPDCYLLKRQLREI